MSSPNGDPNFRAWLPSRGLRSWHAAIIAFAIVLRILPFLTSAFPANDGGLFAVVVDDMNRANFAFPRYFDYNGLEIPFAYPPLGFYAAAIATKLGLSTADALIVIPVAASILTVLAFYPLAIRLLRDERTALFATAVFAFTPRSFNWEIMGGGLTRSLGLLFAIAALTFVYDTFADGNRRAMVVAAILGALALLSHLEMGWYAAFSAAILLPYHRDRLRQNLPLVAVAAGISAALVLPWFIIVVARHGLDPFLAASATGGWGVLGPAQLLTGLFTENPGLDVAAVLGLIGFVALVSSGNYLLPAWIVATFALDPRKAATLGIAPLALLAAVAIFQVVIPGLQAMRRDRPIGTYATRALLAVLVAHLIFGGLAASTLRTTRIWSNGQPLPEAEREAMAWVAAETPEDSRFALLTDATRWSSDRSAEWFPYLTGRVSVATVQGLEWVTGDAFDRGEAAWERLQACGEQGLSCLEAWSEDEGIRVDYVYIATRENPPTDIGERLAACCNVLALELEASPDWEQVYENEAVRIWARRDAGASR